MKSLFNASFLLCILLSVFRSTQSFFITVDAHAEECFFDKVVVGTKMGLTFEVAEGGFLDIDVRIEGPDGKIVHQVEAQNEKKWANDVQWLVNSTKKSFFFTV